MSNIIKKYWKWDEEFNRTDFELGQEIIPLLEKGLVIEDPENENEFFGKDENPWKIKVKNGVIESIFYRDTFFDLKDYGDTLWDMEWKSFEPTINDFLEEVDENYQGDVFYVVFRDFFIAIAGIIRQNPDNI